MSSSGAAARRKTVVKHILRSQDAQIDQLAIRIAPALGAPVSAMTVRTEALRRGIAALEAELRAQGVPALPIEAQADPTPVRPRPTVEADEWGNEPPPPTEAPRPTPLPSSKWATLARPDPPRAIDDAEADAALPDDEAERRFRDLFDPGAP